MTRRSLLGSLAAAAGAPATLPAFQNAIRPGKLAIRDVQFWRVEGKRETLAGVDGQHQVQPLHIYEERRPKVYQDAVEPRRVVQPAAALYLKIVTEQGLEGLYGPIDREAAIVVDLQLKPFLTGKDPLAGETLWDQLHRLNRHSRAGHFMMAISAVDNALWDLRGRYFDAPVWRLLGGATRRSVEAYGSALGFSVQPEALRKRAQQLKQDGFRHQKWFMAYGPGDGTAGLEKNVAMVRNLRDAVGDEVEMMFDAFMGWNLDFAIAWAKQAEKYRPRWIEEAFHMDKLESFVQLRKSTSIPVATGEHFYGRWEAHRFLSSGAISVVQSDPEWCGGVSDLVKTCHIASVYDAQVIPHGHSVHAALHVVASQPPMTCPLVEYLVTKMRSYYQFEKDPPRPVNGQIALPERAGFGIEFDDSQIEKRSQVKWS